MTLGSRLIAVAGRPTGFDYMRMLLALCVVAWHSVVTSYGSEQFVVEAGRVLLWRAGATRYAIEPWRPLVAFILPMFFALSGFLVAGSLERCRSLVSFLGFRAIRIYPALAVEVLLSALILGPLLTTVPLGDYLASPKFAAYLLNMLGDVHFELPGLFGANPVPDRVNAQLWTVPFELLCYVVLAGLAALTLTRRRTLFLAAVGLLWVGSNAWFLVRHGTWFDGRLIVAGYVLLIAFLGGICLYLWRDRVPFSRPLALASAVASVVLLAFPVLGDGLAVIPLAYLTVWLGLANPRKIALLKGADYSYGIFLYGYAIQQAWMSLSPALHHWYWNLALTLPVATLFAAASWHLVEKPALRLRGLIVGIENHWVRHRARFVPRLAGTLAEPARVTR